MKPYDSTPDTNKHRDFVRMLMYELAKDIMYRADHHDDSKLLSPEKELFDEYTPKLRGSTYGSPEYTEYLEGLKVALDHHYAENRHHPEHFPDGMNGMNLVDVVELICDWFAATLRHNNGDIYESLDINKTRFKMDQQTVAILKNTVDTYFSRFSREDYGYPNWIGLDQYSLMTNYTGPRISRDQCFLINLI